MNNKIKLVAVLSVSLFLISLLLTSCNKKEYTKEIIGEVNETIDELDKIGDEYTDEQVKERSRIAVETEEFYFVVNSSQSQYTEDDKALFEALYNYTNQRRVLDMDEETYKSFEYEQTYEEAIEKIDEYRRELDKLIK